MKRHYVATLDGGGAAMARAINVIRQVPQADIEDRNEHYVDITLPEEEVGRLRADLERLGVGLEPAPEAELMEPIPIARILADDD